LWVDDPQLWVDDQRLIDGLTMRDPLISVIMPAYNAERHITAAIQSVLDQTYQRWELIVVDDGSTDATAEIARRFASSDNRIKCISQQNQKQAKARNVGIEGCGGELVAFLDSDDLWIREKLELQAKALLEHNADLVFSDGFVFQDDNVVDESLTFSPLQGSFGGAEMFALLMMCNRIPILSVLMRRNVWEEVGGFDESPRHHGVEDYDLWLTIARRGYRFYGMKERLARYRVHGDSTSRQIAAMLMSEVAVVEKHLPASNMNAELKLARLRSLYRNLALALADDGKPAEARQCLRQLLISEKGGLTTRLQILALGILPGRFNYISNQLCRIEASISYRIGRPITRIEKGFQTLLGNHR
jgi:glycosyltransferase involved in cell wall biosynthesis